MTTRVYHITHTKDLPDGKMIVYTDPPAPTDDSFVLLTPQSADFIREHREKHRELATGDIFDLTLEETTE